MFNEKTRYSKNPDNANRKNTLVTLQDGETIFFGISRCNRDAGDRFLKARGRTAAKARAIRASIEFKSVPNDLKNKFVANANGLRGHCAVADVKEVLKYFQNIDQIMFEEARASR